MRCLVFRWCILTDRRLSHQRNAGQCNHGVQRRLTSLQFRAFCNYDFSCQKIETQNFVHFDLWRFFSSKSENFSTFFNFVHSGLNGILIVQLWSEFDKRIVVNSYIGDSLNIGRLVLISWERSTHSFHACFIGRCMLVSDSTQQPSSPLVSYAHCKLRTPCDGAYSSIRGLFIDGRSNNLA